jgi:peptide chain release factor 3
MESVIVGAVGVLQIEVLEHRLKHEYGVDLRVGHLPYRHARWIVSETDDIRRLNLTSSTMLVVDSRETPVLLLENEWNIRWAEEKNAGLVLTDIQGATDGGHS